MTCKGICSRYKAQKAGRNRSLCIRPKTMPDMWDIHQMGRTLVSMLWIQTENQTTKSQVQGKASCSRWSWRTSRNDSNKGI